MSQTQGSSDQHYVKGIVFSLWGNAASIVGGLLIIAAASRFLSPVELGTYYIIFMMVNVSIAFTSIGGRNVIIKFLSGATPQARENMANILISFRVMAIVFLTVGLTLFLVFLDALFPEQSLCQLKRIILPIVLMEILNSAGMSMLAGFTMFKPFGVFHGVRGILAGLVSVLVLYLGFGLTGLLWANVFVNASVSIIIWYMLPVRYRLVWDSSEMVNIIKFSGALYLAYLMSVLSARTAEGLIVTFAGTAAVAIYGNAMRFPNLLIRLFEAVRPVLLSYFSSDRAEQSQVPLKLASVSIALAASLLMVLAKPLTLFIFSGQYLACVPLTRLLCFWVVLSLINYFLVVHLIGAGLVMKVLWLNVIQFALVFMGHVYLIPKFGAIGAAMSITIAAIFTIPVSLFFLARRGVMHIGSLLVTSFKPVLPLFTLFMAIHVYEPGMVNLALYWGLYVLCLFGLNAFPLKEIRASLNHRRVGNHAIG